MSWVKIQNLSSLYVSLSSSEPTKKICEIGADECGSSNVASYQMFRECMGKEELWCGYYESLAGRRSVKVFKPNGILKEIRISKIDDKSCDCEILPIRSGFGESKKWTVLKNNETVAYVVGAKYVVRKLSLQFINDDVFNFSLSPGTPLIDLLKGVVGLQKRKIFRDYVFEKSYDYSHSQKLDFILLIALIFRVSIFDLGHMLD